MSTALPPAGRHRPAPAPGRYDATGKSIAAGAQPAAETALAPPGEPIYAELAAAWRAMDRTVPG
ncbi:hypothetical protein [Kitasatospora sp. NPDC087271]|uniref:hypothetical protein n=1 Tax=Kitasatospora sp. NPDC087271 TaxID=3364067 RepID=UPI003829E530